MMSRDRVSILSSSFAPPLLRVRAFLAVVMLTAFTAVGVAIPMNAEAATVATWKPSATVDAAAGDGGATTNRYPASVTAGVSAYPYKGQGGSITVSVKYNGVIGGAYRSVGLNYRVYRIDTTSGVINISNSGSNSVSNRTTTESAFNYSMAGQPAGYAYGFDHVEFDYPSMTGGVVSQAYYPAGHPLAGEAPPPVITGGNCVMSDVQLAGLARQAGFPDAQVPTAVAVAIAESRGRVNALNKNTNGSYDIGLWQINDTAHPTYDRNKLGVNPLYNASAAFDIYTAASNSFSPWVTFNKGIF